MTVPPDKGRGPLTPYKRCENEDHVFLPSSTWLATTRVKPWRSSFSLINLMRVITLRGWLMRPPTRLIDMIAHVLWRLAGRGNSMSELRTRVARVRLQGG